MADGPSLKPHWFQILLAVADEPRHGTAVMEEVLERTDGEMKLWPGTLYGSLRDLEDAGLIREVCAPPDAPTEGGKRRFYEATHQGRLAAREEVERIAGYVRAARAKNLADGLEPV